MSPALRFRLLRIALLFSALVWSISVLGVFLSWEAAVNALQGMGAQPISYDKMLDYWLRMASGAFALIGSGFLVPAWDPRKSAICLTWLSVIMIAKDLILLGHGLRLGLAPFPFWGDFSACFAGGMGIHFCKDAAKTNPT